MRIAEIESFSNAPDPVRTEETISRQLMERYNQIDSAYTYVSLPLAWNINNRGIAPTQRLIDEICFNLSSEKLFFVCQHILVDQLEFHGNLVFTPHATALDAFVPIPHYSCNYDPQRAKAWEDRQYTFSFMGSFHTHPVRRKLYDSLKSRDDCLIVDTGNWHFEGAPEKQQLNSEEYIQILGDTKYSLCPRGTGPSTIRIWEAMAMGSTPLILSDFLQMPLERELDTSWVRIPENFDMATLDAAASNLEEYDSHQYFHMFSNDNLYKTIVREI